MVRRWARQVKLANTPASGPSLCHSGDGACGSPSGRCSLHPACIGSRKLPVAPFWARHYSICLAEVVSMNNLNSLPPPKANFDGKMVEEKQEQEQHIVVGIRRMDRNNRSKNHRKRTREPSPHVLSFHSSQERARVVSWQQPTRCPSRPVDVRPLPRRALSCFER